MKAWKCLSLGVSRVVVLDQAEITACLVQETNGADTGLSLSVPPIQLCKSCKTNFSFLLQWYNLPLKYLERPYNHCKAKATEPFFKFIHIF